METATLLVDTSFLGDVLLAELAAVLTELGGQARLLSFSHVSRRTGARLPAQAMVDLAHQCGRRPKNEFRSALVRQQAGRRRGGAGTASRC